MEVEEQELVSLNKRILALETAVKDLSSNEEIAERLKKVEDTLYSTKGMLTIQEAAKLFNLSKSTFYKLTSENKVPFYKPTGGKLFFLKEDLLKWFQETLVMPVDERTNASEKEGATFDTQRQNLD